VVNSRGVTLPGEGDAVASLQALIRGTIRISLFLSNSPNS
jgi:hypothetical protein